MPLIVFLLLLLLFLFKLFSIVYLVKIFKLYPQSLHSNNKPMFCILAIMLFYIFQWIVVHSVLGIGLYQSLWLDLYFVLLIPVVWFFRNYISLNLKLSRILLVAFTCVLVGILAALSENVLLY